MSLVPDFSLKNEIKVVESFFNESIVSNIMIKSSLQFRSEEFFKK